MTVVSDTGPLIALAKVDHLPLLKALFGHVLIPPVVQRELLAKHGAEASRLDDALADFVTVAAAPPLEPEVRRVTSRLDLGEQQPELRPLTSPPSQPAPRARRSAPGYSGCHRRPSPRSCAGTSPAPATP